MGIEKLKSRYEVVIRWRAFPLHPETPEEGLTLEELFAGRDISVPAVLRRLRKVAGDEDWRLSREWGITAVPTFLLNGERLVGAQPDGVLEELVRKHHVPERKG